LRVASQILVSSVAELGFDMDDEGAAGGLSALRLAVTGQAVSRAAGSTSWSWIGPMGITVDIACLYTSCA